MDFKYLYDENYISLISEKIKINFNEFDVDSFKPVIFNENWKNRELKDRMRHISTSLALFLPDEYKKSIEILKKSFYGFDKKYALQNMIFQDFVEVYGLEYLEISLDALEVFTINSSSEFAIRRFIIKYEEKTMARMKLWALNENEEIRRLASEGCRSRLPWAIALASYKNNPSKILEILDLLKDDESEYVRKSVANNINDISKDNPAIVVDLVEKWINYSKNRDKLLKHGSRTLLKQRDKNILELFGLKSASHVELRNVEIQDEVIEGKELEFSFELHSNKKLGLIRLEYEMGFLLKNNKHSKKVFKISESTYDAKIKKVLKKHSFRSISTRVYYKGEQKLSIIINGEIKKELVFNLC